MELSKLRNTRRDDRFKPEPWHGWVGLALLCVSATVAAAFSFLIGSLLFDEVYSSKDTKSDAVIGSAHSHNILFISGPNAPSTYYSALLLPLLLLPTALAIYLNWFSMQLFEHN